MGKYSFNTKNEKGMPLRIDFNVTDTTINPNILPFVKVDSGTYVTLKPYVSRLSNWTMTPMEPASPFNVITSGIIFTFTRDSLGWTVAYQYPCPIYQDDPIP